MAWTASSQWSRRKTMEPKAYSYIRFSTPEQALGDSLRRQIQLSEEYAKKHGLTLDDTTMIDRGLSAYKGINRSKGTLREFLHKVETGQIAPGSLFIVEDLDRLSRERISDALPQFMGILRAGIKVVTLQDGMEYDQERINRNMGGPLMICILKMALAHDESEKKAIRLRAAWEEKRNSIQERKLTGKAPAWLKLSKDKTDFLLIPERAKVIELIYRKRLEGKGITRIETELNADSDIWRPANGWRKSYIVKILRSRAVIGEFQPHKMVDGKRQPIGDPIPDYFPPAISEELFYQVQAILKANAERSGNAGGRTGKAKNLFTHIVKCGLCGSPMHFIDKGKSSKGGLYLHCDKSRRLKQCPAKSIRYDEFERLFFDNFEELDIGLLIPGRDETQARVTELEALVTVNRQRILEIDSEIENLSDSIARTKHPQVREHLEGRLAKAFDEKARLEAENQGYDRELTQLRQEKATLTQDVEQAREIYALLESCQSEKERIDLRFRLRQQIRKMVEWIKIYPLQEPYQKIQETEEPYVYKVMDSKHLDKVRIKFTGSRNLRVLLLKSYIDTEGIKLDIS
jgi:DNA invertase Pin-like site-specific DNA recombinase